LLRAKKTKKKTQGTKLLQQRKEGKKEKEKGINLLSFS